MIMMPVCLDFFQVLIVPLWNWNWKALQTEAGRIRFNRTFMELKFVTKYSANIFSYSFNRTFMELKLSLFYVVLLCFDNVLIVPLWNWNEVYSNMKVGAAGF